MKTLLFTLEYPPFKGGVANYYGNIIEYWPKPGNISVLHNNDNILLKNWLWPKWLPAIWQLWHTIKKQKIKHILVGHILPLGTVAFLVAKFTKTNYTIFLHGMDFTYALLNQRKKWLAKKILNNAKYIICGNSYTAGLVKKFVGNQHKDKIAVANPGIDVRITHNPANASQNGAGVERITRLKEKHDLHNKIILLTVGRLVKRKGVDKVLESLPNVLKKTPNLIYVILGNGPEITNYKLQITNLGLEKNVIIINSADDNEKNNWYQICDIFIMPARNINGDFEGFGIVYLEANLCNKPVIAGDSGGVRDAVEDHENGILVDPKSADAIADGILELALDQRLRNELGRQGWRRAIEKFNWEKQVRLIYNIINNS